MNTWVLICNTQHFNAPLALEENGYVYWSMKLHFEKNDIAYIYVTGAAGKIKYKTFVEEIDIPFFDGIQKRYLPNHIEEEPDTRKFVKLRLEAINDKPLLYFSDMKSVGEKLCMVRHFKLNNKPRLIEYIQDVFC